MEAMQIILSTEEAAQAMGITPRGIRERIEKGSLRADTVESGVGQGGASYAIPLSALSFDERKKYWLSVAQRQMQGTPTAFDLVGYGQRKGELGMRELLKKQEAVLAARAIREASGRDVTQQLRELAASYGISERTLRRWEDGYEADGFGGLARDKRADAGQSRTMCKEARRFICERYLQPSKPSQATVLDLLMDRARELGPRGCDECPYNPSSANHVALQGTPDAAFFPACDCVGNGIIIPDKRYPVNRVIASISQEEKTYMRKGRKPWEAAFMMKASRAKGDIVNEAWYGDHHQADVFVIDENGKLCRPWLTVWEDIGSGVITGWCISKNPNSTTIAESFARGIALKKNSPIHGVPATVYMDNGRDYIGKRFEGSELKEYELHGLNDSLNQSGILRVLHVEAKHARYHHGWVKPVERFFETLEKKYFCQMPGYGGGKPEDWPENFMRQLDTMQRRGELLTLDEFGDIFMNEVLPAYHNRPHDGYGGQTPAERYAKLPKARNDQPDWNTLAIIRLESAERMVSTQGVTFDKVLYWHENLRHMVGERVILRYNRGDTRSLTVVSRKGLYICEAEPKAYFRHVGEDEERIAAHIALQKRQENEVRLSIRARGVKLPGKRASGNMFYEVVDEAARGNLCDFQAAKAMAGRAEVEQKREARKARDEGDDRVRAMLRKMGGKVLGAK